MSELESIKSTLTKLLSGIDNSKLYRYMLIDELASVNDLDYISVSSLQQLLGENRVTTLVRPNLSHDLESCPKLITLAQPDEDIDTNIIHFSAMQSLGEYQERNRFICGWFVSEYSPEIITQQFILLGEKLANFCQTPFIPIYEPFRLFLLRNSNVFCPEWLLYSFKFIKTYAYFTIDKQLDIFDSKRGTPSDIFLAFDAQILQKDYKAVFYFYRAWRELEISFSSLKRLNGQIIFQAYYKTYEWLLTDIKDRSTLGLMLLKYGDITGNTHITQAIFSAKKDPGTLADKFKKLEKSCFIIKNDGNEL